MSERQGGPIRQLQLAVEAADAIGAQADVEHGVTVRVGA
jgi:hypothetical protein